MIHNIRFSTYDRFVILQVQDLPKDSGFYSEQSLAWRDAKIEDLLAVSEHLTSRYKKETNE